MKTVIPLSKMKSGKNGVVVAIEGGIKIVQRLEALGIRLDKKVLKVSGMLFGGPIIVKVGQCQFGIGYGMASKILVEVAK
jgi:ferrous iron transport protein A